MLSLVIQGIIENAINIPEFVMPTAFPRVFRFPNSSEDDVEVAIVGADDIDVSQLLIEVVTSLASSRSTISVSTVTSVTASLAASVKTSELKITCWSLERRVERGVNDDALFVWSRPRCSNIITCNILYTIKNN